MKLLKLAVLCGAVALPFAAHVVIGAPDALAQAPKYQRTTPKVKVDVKQTERTKKLSERALKTKKETRPTLTSEQFLDVQGQVGGIRKSQQSKLVRLIKITGDDNPDKPKLLFRLAESFSKEQRYYRFRAFELYEKIESPRYSNQRGKLKSQQKQWFAKEKKALTSAIKIYALLANNSKFRNYEKMDEVLFYYAYTLQSAKRIPLSRTVFKRLIQNYPKSKYVPWAYLSFADYFFEKGELNNADLFYGKVLEFPRSQIYNLALYKRGWVFMNQDRNQDALETFFKVANRTKGKKQYDVLNRAAKKDFVRAYAEVGKAQRAHNAFKRVDNAYAFDMLKILALLYFDQGKAAKAIYTFRELMRLKPKHKEVCEWQYNVQQAMLGAGSKQDVVVETAQLAKLYTVVRDRKILSGAALSECRENAQLVTAELAKLWHSEANKTLNFQTLQYAEGLYEAYVQYFPNAKDIGMMEYYYAELLWSRADKTDNPRLATERWEKAAVAFTDVVKRNKVSPKFRKESAYAAVLGWKNALRVDPRTKTAPPPVNLEEAKEVKPREIDGREKKMIDAFDVYIRYIKDPKDEELVMMKFLKARIYWRHDQLDKALPLFQDIVEVHPTHETALYSANIMLDSLIRMKQFDQLLKWTNKLLKNQKFLEDKDSLRERLADIKAKSMRKAAEQLEEEKRWVECGEAYLDIFETSPNSPGMEEVLYNAGVCFEEGKSIGFAIRMYGELRKRFPKSKQSERALARMGNAYAAIARYKQAAALYEEYANKYAGEKDASNALNDAVVYRKGIGDDRQAIKNIEEFVKKFKRKRFDDAAAAFFGMAGIYEKQNKDEMVIRHLKRYISEFGRKGGRDRLIAANAKIGEILWNRSCRAKGVDGACVKVARERALRRKKRRRGGGAAVPNRCGESDRIVLTVIDRNRTYANQARGFFRNAIREWQKGGADGIPEERLPGAAYWAFAAKFYMADAEYEEFLDIKFPEGMNFDPQKPKTVEKSKKRFADWLKKKSQVGAKVDAMYKEILNGNSAAWAIAAAARMGQIPQNFADGLYRAEVPAIARTGPYAEDLYFAYCGALEDEAKPLEQRSIAAFTFCLEETTKRNWFNQWARLCEEELGQINPQDFPAALEVHGEPDSVAPVTDTSGLIPQIADE
jgi:TolA-binding protein